MRFFLAGLAIMQTGVAAAEERRLDASEISDLLTGSTLVGEHKGVNYRQYFGENARTSLNLADSAERVGRWRVDEADDILEIRWASSNTWQPYRVCHADGEVMLTPPGKKPSRTGRLLNSRGFP